MNDTSPTPWHRYVAVLKGWDNFKGRSSRAEYFNFLFIHVLISAGLLGVAVTGLSYSLVVVYGVLTFLPHLAASVRRLQDTGKSGWWVLLGFITPFGTILLLLLLAKDSQKSSNLYGPNPKGE